MLTITSPAFANDEKIPPQYTCDGDDINPPIFIEGVPAKAASLVLIVDDPDAPMGTWDHWIVWNIDPSIAEISENSVPTGAILGTNSFNRLKYGGPCPPSGVHRYFFRLFALDKMLDLPEGSSKEELEQLIDKHVVERSELMGKYARLNVS